MAWDAGPMDEFAEANGCDRRRPWFWKAVALLVLLGMFFVGCWLHGCLGRVPCHLPRSVSEGPVK